MNMRARSVLQILAYTGVIVAAAAAGLLAVVSRQLGVDLNWSLVSVAALGTFFIYGLDRLRDIDSDALTSPKRSAFFERHEVSMHLPVFAAGLAAVAVGLRLNWASILLLAVTVGIGLAHRLLKKRIDLKAAYITVSWMAVVVGLPVIESGASSPPFAATFVVGLCLFSNALITSICDAGSSAAQWRQDSVALWAKGLAGAATTVAIVYAYLWPGQVTAVLWPLPTATFAAVLLFKSGAGADMDEDYGLIVVDGALILGAAGSLMAAWLR